MKKLLFVLLLPLACPSAANVTDPIDILFSIPEPMYFNVFAGPEFTLQAQLTVTPHNYEKWVLAGHKGLDLVSYRFEQDTSIGSVGTQIWTFKAPKAGFYKVHFFRGAHENKTINIRANNALAY